MRMKWDMLWLPSPSESTVYVRAFTRKYMLGAVFKPDQRTFSYAAAVGVPARDIFTAALTCPVFTK